MASIADRVGTLGDYLREQRQHAQLSVRQLANLAGVSNPYLSQIERGLKKPSAEVLQQIARGLQISSEALYIRAGILDQPEPVDLARAIQSDRSITDRQRRVLLDIYTAFRAENQRQSDVAAAAAADEVVDPEVASHHHGGHGKSGHHGVSGSALRHGGTSKRHPDPEADLTANPESTGPADREPVVQHHEDPTPPAAPKASLRRRTPKEKS